MGKAATIASLVTTTALVCAAFFAKGVAARTDCFSQTLQGYILYKADAGCTTDEDCVNLCDCGASCIDVKSGCDVHTKSGAANPDILHICPYLHTVSGAVCKICPSGECSDKCNETMINSSLRASYA